MSNRNTPTFFQAFAVVTFGPPGPTAAVLASQDGGVASIADVAGCKAAGLFGVIVGKALYEKRMDLAAALAVAEG